MLDRKAIVAVLESILDYEQVFNIRNNLFLFLLKIKCDTCYFFEKSKKFSIKYVKDIKIIMGRPFIGLAHYDDLAGIDHVGWGCEYVPQYK